MEAFEQRMLQESKDLGKQINKLCDFMKTEDFKKVDSFEQFLLSLQVTAMEEYFDALEKRIQKRGLRTVEAEVTILG
jgi:hypothetical protein